MEFENYDVVAGAYDRTRVPVGVEIILGCFATNARTLDQQMVLDAGCGTGNYLVALGGCFKALHGTDINNQMLTCARNKLGGRQGVHVVRGSVLALPYRDSLFDGLMCNQVIHHLDDAAGFPNTQRMLAEARRVLRPGGVIVVNTCSHRQLFDGFWWSDLISEAMSRVSKRYAAPELIADLMEEAGLAFGGMIVPVDVVLQGRGYLDPTGPLKKEYRNGDSTWSLATPEELRRALTRVEAMNHDGTIADYLRDRDSLRRDVGQTTFLFARRR